MLEFVFDIGFRHTKAWTEICYFKVFVKIQVS